MQVLHDTVQKWPEKQHLKQQEVHIPTSLLGGQRGTYTRQFKTMTVHGTVRIRDDRGNEYLASYATCRHAKMEIMCLTCEEDEAWHGIDARPIEKGTKKK